MTQLDYKFIIELSPPLDPNEIPSYYDKFKSLIKYTACLGLVSKANGPISGFEKSYNLARFLRDREPQVELLFHLTCKDLNRVNIGARLTALKDLEVERVLVITGEDYSMPSGKVSSFYYENSTQLVEHIFQDFKGWFKSIAIAGYPSENLKLNHAECVRLNEKLRRLPDVDTIYTQSILVEPGEFESFKREILSLKDSLKVIPSMAMFKDQSSYDRAWRLTRGKASSSTSPKISILESAESEELAKRHLATVCRKLKGSRASAQIYICTFELFEIVEEMIETLRRLDS